MAETVDDNHNQSDDGKKQKAAWRLIKINTAWKVPY